MSRKAISRDGHPVTIVRSYFEEGVEFAVIRYDDGHLPYDVNGRVAGTPEAPLWEHRVEDGKVVRPGGDYWNPEDWVVEEGLRLLECEGHPAGEFDPMGETVYCDGSCQA